jgi:4-hydroxy-2-oxoheptanedioate aldolase
VAIMVEKKSLYDKLEDVMNLNGVDMIQFGPCDFSMTLKLWGQWSHPKIQEAEEKIIKMALKYDKHPRAEINSINNFEKNLQRYINMGVTDFCIGFDVLIIFEWMKKYGELTRKALEKI